MPLILVSAFDLQTKGVWNNAIIVWMRSTDRHIEAEIECQNDKKDFTEVCSLGSKQQNHNIGSITMTS